MKKVSTGSTVDLVASELREVLLAAEDGTFLGSELTIAGQLGVSGPTLRQAARLLESEQLLQIRRGIAGGYYVRRPTLDVVIRMAATYLKTQQVSVGNALLVVNQLVGLLARCAAACDDPGLREELLTFEARMAGTPPEPPSNVEHELAMLLGRMSGNALLQMVLAITSAHGGMRGSSPEPPWPQEGQFLQMRQELIDAVLRRDGNAAERVALDRFDVLTDIVSKKLAHGTLVQTAVSTQERQIRGSKQRRQRGR
jgi:DNA-binding FadR family transcriptional regulator